jgi:hypothetical protein
VAIPIPLLAAGDCLSESGFADEHEGDYARTRTTAESELQRPRSGGAPAAPAYFQETRGLVPGDDA